jgi:drug/metabolite transporter (DMT)-like permease
LWLTVVTTLLGPVTFVFTTLIHEPASAVTLLGILALSAGLDLVWKRRRARTRGESEAEVG